MGLAVVDGMIYVSQKHELTELRDTDGDEVADAQRTVATWPFGGNFHEFAFGLLYKDGNFYLNLSVAINLGGATTDPQPAAGRGTSIVVNRRTGKVTTWPAGCAPRTASAGARTAALRHRQPGRLAAGVEAGADQAGPVLQPLHQPGRPVRRQPGDQAGAVAAAERDRQLAEHAGAAQDGRSRARC